MLWLKACVCVCVSDVVKSFDHMALKLKEKQPHRQRELQQRVHAECFCSGADAASHYLRGLQAMF